MVMVFRSSGLTRVALATMGDWFLLARMLILMGVPCGVEEMLVLPPGVDAGLLN